MLQLSECRGAICSHINQGINRYPLWDILWIDLIKAQMDQVKKLQTENEHLSNVAMNGNEGSVAGGRPQTYVTMINAGLNDIE